MLKIILYVLDFYSHLEQWLIYLNSVQFLAQSRTVCSELTGTELSGASCGFNLVVDRLKEVCQRKGQLSMD